MKRTEVSAKLKEVTKAIEKIESQEDIALYYTTGKFLPKVGHIHEVDSVADLVIAHDKVIQQSKPQYGDAMAALGVTEAEMGNVETKILGYSPKYWIKDIETRLIELRTEIKYKKLKEAKAVLEKYITTDDKFNIDMEILNDII